MPHQGKDKLHSQARQLRLLEIQFYEVARVVDGETKFRICPDDEIPGCPVLRWRSKPLNILAAQKSLVCRNEVRVRGDLLAVGQSSKGSVQESPISLSGTVILNNSLPKLAPEIYLGIVIAAFLNALTIVSFGDPEAATKSMKSVSETFGMLLGCLLATSVARPAPWQRL